MDQQFVLLKHYKATYLTSINCIGSSSFSPSFERRSHKCTVNFRLGTIVSRTSCQWSYRLILHNGVLIKAGSD